MLKKKYYLINWLIVAVVCLVYITLTPQADTIKELIATWLIALTVGGLGVYLDDIITKSKKGGYTDYDDRESL